MTGALFGPVAQAAWDDLDEDCRVLGLSPATLPPVREDEGGVWPCNVAAVDAFLAVSRQWRSAAGGMERVRYLGLDYAGAKAGFELAGIDVSPDLWARVRVIEAGAVAALNGEVG